VLHDALDYVEKNRFATNPRGRRLFLEAKQWFLADKNADAWVDRNVKLALLFHCSVNARKTVVEVKGAIVTLKGEASSAVQKELTIDYAKDIEGVTSVKN